MSPTGAGLETRVGAVRRRLTGRTLAAAAVWAGTAAGCGLVLAWVLAGPEGWRQGSGLPLLLDGAIVASAAALLLGARAKARRWFGDRPVASAMERAAGVPAGLVLGALELVRAVPPGVSGALAARAEQEVSRALEASGADLGGELAGQVARWVRRGGAALGFVGVLAALLAVAAPARAARAWGGLARPLAVMAEPRLPPLVVSPGSVDVPRGSDVEVRVEAPGRDRAVVHWQGAGDVAREDTLALAGGVGVMRFPALAVRVEYRVEVADGAASDTYRLTPVDPLFVGDLRVEVAYPPHTGLPPAEFRGTVPPLTLPEGTLLLLAGEASRPLGVAALLDASGDPLLRLEVDGGRFEGSWRPASAGRFPWRFEDPSGAPAELVPEPLDVALVADSAPRVAIPLPGRDTLLSLSLRQPLVLEARDDYGLRRLELVAYRVTSDGEAGERVVQGLDLGGARSALARPLLDLASWGLLPGDEVRYFARVLDNAPRAQEGVTPEYVLRLPRAAELRREAGERLDETARRLEELAAEAERRAGESRDLGRERAAERPAESGRPGQPTPADPMGFEEREELREAVEGQQRLAGEVDSLRAELESLERALEEAGQADPGLAADLAELQRLLEELAGGAMAERLEALAAEAAGGDASRATRSLQELAEEQERFRERLEQSLERFRQAAVEQDFRATRGEAEDLARKEKALADAFREGDRPDLRALQQDEAAAGAKALQEQMERLRERLDAQGDGDAASRVREALEAARRSEQEMEAAAQEARRRSGEQAARRADEAARSMEEAARSLEEAQGDRARQGAQAAREALEAAADGALALARRQAALRAEMDRAAPEALQGMRGDVAALSQGVRNLAQALFEGAPEALAGNPTLSIQMGRAMESLDRTVQALEGRRGSVPSPSAAASQAVADLNQVALLALAGSEQGGEQGQGEGEGGQDTAEQLQQAAQQQGDVANQAGQLAPMQLGERALREQLERLAAQQEGVARELEELSGRPEAREESLGDLEALAAEARALAEALGQGRLSPETLRRQERLFHRLLDAGRSLEREDQEPSEERESRTPGAFERPAALPLGEERLGAVRYRLPGAEELRGLPPAVRQLVLQYFERLNRGGGGAGR